MGMESGAHQEGLCVAVQARRRRRRRFEEFLPSVVVDIVEEELGGDPLAPILQQGRRGRRGNSVPTVCSS